MMARPSVSTADGNHNDEGDDCLDSAHDFIFTFKRLDTDIQINHNRFRLDAEYVKGENNVDGEVVELSEYYFILVGKTS